METRMRITILCENLVGRLVGWGEHGFSVFIEVPKGITSSIRVMVMGL